VGIKGALKNIFGEAKLSAIKGMVCHCGCKAGMLVKRSPALKIVGNVKMFWRRTDTTFTEVITI